jgi:hypothetical protein
MDTSIRIIKYSASMGIEVVAQMGMSPSMGIFFNCGNDDVLNPTNCHPYVLEVYYEQSTITHIPSISCTLKIKW